jgi:Cation/multidrug efflux pump
MWIVALALRRPYTFVVMAMLIIILTIVTIPRTPVDIFPDINIPVVSVVWNYGGFSPGGHGRSHRDQLRARIHGHSQRY